MERLTKGELDKTGELILRLPWKEEQDFIFKTFFNLISLHAKYNEVIIKI